MRRKEKKSRKLRGRTRTMGWGRIGQHRKSGSRGGFGAAGMHKHKWSWVVKYAPEWFGKHGFTHPISHKITINHINVGELNEIIENMRMSGKFEEENGLIKVDLNSIGINKLLGKGKVTKPLLVIVSSATSKAIKKIEEAGGRVIVKTKK